MTNERRSEPIEEYLDDLLRRTHSNPRTARRLLDEAGDHLYSAAEALQSTGLDRRAAEREAVRRLGPPDSLARATRRSLSTLAIETLDAGILLVGTALGAIGVSGVVVAAMNALFGNSFVGATTVFGTGGSSVAETTHDAISLRVLAGVLGVALLGVHAIRARRTPAPVVLPRSLVDGLGAAAFTAAAVALSAASVQQAWAGPNGSGVGWFLSGAIVAVPFAAVFLVRAMRQLLHA